VISQTIVFDAATLSCVVWSLLNRFRTGQGPSLQICIDGALPS